jgi:hypothetical protein
MKNIGQKLFQVYLVLVGVWIVFALSFDIYMTYLHFTDQDQTIRTIVDTLDRSLDERFKTK